MVNLDNICPIILGTKGLTCRWYFRIIWLLNITYNHPEPITTSAKQFLIGSTTALYYYNMKMYDHVAMYIHVYTPW